jgi:hypothetical protein
MNCLQDICGDDKLKQFELPCAVTYLSRQGVSKTKELKQSVATNSILKGLEATFALIAERSFSTSSRGRYKLTASNSHTNWSTVFETSDVWACVDEGRALGIAATLLSSVDCQQGRTRCERYGS